ncbi:MAG: fumarylacetoacetase [Comamonadaceae bacterium BICA1-1]|nr:MAG: fumarylacetoacetase [Comamonadaceae bacterium BICA1-1]
MNPYLFAPPPVAALPILGLPQRFPVNRLFFVGRNYAAHAAEMGFTVDKARETPFYFTKSVSALAPSGITLPYPPGTANFHYEVELVVALHRPGFRVLPEQAPELIYGYAVGLDMTRRDLQQAARELGRPWDLGKDVEHGAVCSELRPLPGQVLAPAAIGLQVNGQTRQSACTEQLIWSIPELIADLSRFYHLQPGDLIYTGTPEGVGPVQLGDQLRGWVEGVGEVAVAIGPQA